MSGISGTAYLDTGARTSLASPELYNILVGRKFTFTQEILQITLADGHHRTQIVKKTTVPVQLKGRTITTTFLILPNTPQAKTLLGIDFIEEAGLVLDFRQRKWHFSESRHKQYGFVQKDEAGSTTPSEEELAAMLDEFRNVQACTPLASSPSPVECDDISGLSEGYGPEAVPTMPERGHERPQANQWSRTEFMYQDAVAAINDAWSDVDFLSGHGWTPRHNIDLATFDVTELHTLKEGHNLTNDEKQKLSQLLAEHSDVFEITGPPTPYAEHRIDTGNHPPISCPPYRLTPGKAEELRRQLEELMAENIIEECESAWAAPVALVPKPGGGIRLCVDYRRLNSVTILTSTPSLG